MMQPEADVARQLSCRGPSDSDTNVRITSQFAIPLLELHMRLGGLVMVHVTFKSNEFHAFDNEI